MKTKLKNITAIRSGIFAKPRPDANIYYLQVKDFDEYMNLYEGRIPELIIDGQTENHLLKPDDVLFAAKGSKNFAVAYTPKFGQCVASSSFNIISLLDEYKENILPDYLAWYLNRPDVAGKLKNKAKGTSIPSISKADMEEVEIYLPTIKKQQTILKINELQQKERNIRKRIMELREVVLQQQLIKALKK